MTAAVVLEQWTKTTAVPAAREPPEARGLARDGVRLLVSRGGGELITHARFRHLPDYLRARRRRRGERQRHNQCVARRRARGRAWPARGAGRAASLDAAARRDRAAVGHRAAPPLARRHSPAPRGAGGGAAAARRSGDRHPARALSGCRNTRPVRECASGWRTSSCPSGYSSMPASTARRSATATSGTRGRSSITRRSSPRSREAPRCRRQAGPSPRGSSRGSLVAACRWCHWCCTRAWRASRTARHRIPSGTACRLRPPRR